MKTCCMARSPRWPLFIGLAVIALFAVSWAVDAQDAEPAPGPELVRAQAAMDDLGQRLKAALTQKMQAEGPVAAVGFCHEEAPAIAANVAVAHGVRVGRTAVRHRSAANAPNDWQREVLEQFASQTDVPPGQRVFARREGGQLRVARGIPVEAPCLACHGSTIAAPVQAAITAHYPGDPATGFAEGDLRGMFWAEVPLSTEGEAR